MNSLRDAIDRIEGLQKTLEVYTDEESIATVLKTQFSTRNVRVTHHPLPEREHAGFIIIRDATGDFRGALGVDHLQAILSPEIRPPWTLEESDIQFTELFDFLDNTIFTSYTRRQMLATAREIEERAWRTNSGQLYAGFQNASAFRAQLPVYNRFATERDVDLQILIEDEWGSDVAESIDVVTDARDEIGQFWLVIFDGGHSELNMCGLVAEERQPDHYYGFWTYDPERVSELISYLESTYGSK